MCPMNVSHGNMSDFASFSLLGFTSVIKLKNFDFENHWNTLIFFDKKIYDVRFEYVPWNNVWFCFISIVFGSHFVIKLRNFDFESHWNTLIFFDKKYMPSDSIMWHGKVSDFTSLSLFRLNFVIKLKNFNFESYWNTLKALSQVWDTFW